MAPDLALKALEVEQGEKLILDPMCGSGTVLRTAVESGHRACGFDMDPLAVLMSSVWTNSSSLVGLTTAAESLVSEAKKRSGFDAALPWLDGDSETLDFIEFWFAEKQRADLRLLAHLLYERTDRFADGLRLALSRIIITKKTGASLAWDVSHSRPHRVGYDNDYDVMVGIVKSAAEIEKRMSRNFGGSACVERGDARNLKSLSSSSVDLVVTSPPYLNAIDYLRGHRMALVWLGYKLKELREIRGSSVGAERMSQASDERLIGLAADSDLSQLSARMTGIFWRYVEDMSKVMAEISRVLKPGARAVLVVGNSTIKGTFVDNAGVTRRAGILHGLEVESVSERELPAGRRYLPPPSANGSAMDSRMRTEVVLNMIKPCTAL
jgi:SAM-dependent methyltransferase